MCFHAILAITAIFVLNFGMISGRDIDKVSASVHSHYRGGGRMKSTWARSLARALADVSSSESGSLQLNDDVIVKGGGLG